MNEIEIYEHKGENYHASMEFDTWLVAFLNYHERFDKNNINQMERHMLTDEAFVLLSGQAVLIIGDEHKQYLMEPNKIYNIKKGIWHAISVTKDAQVLIVENSNTSIENSEYKEIKVNVDLI